MNFKIYADKMQLQKSTTKLRCDIILKNEEIKHGMKIHKNIFSKFYFMQISNLWNFVKQ